MTQHVYLHAITHLARDASAFDFRPVDGTPLAPFTAGAHVDLILPNGVRRSYSLCNSQDETHRYVVGVKKASPSRGASVYLHEQLRVGAEIDIAPPRNNFSLIESAPHSVLIAGGIGVTPIWAMTPEPRRARRVLGAALREPDRGKTRRFVDELERLAAADTVAPAARLQSRAGGGRLDLDEIVASGALRARISTPAARRGCSTPSNRRPPRLPRERVHLERFGAGGEAIRDRRIGFRNRCSRAPTGRFDVPADKSILDVLLDEGVDVAFSCMDGVCGSCKVGVLEGMPDHRDVVLDAEERAANGTMMVCCSRALSERLVLDI